MIRFVNVVFGLVLAVSVVESCSVQPGYVPEKWGIQKLVYNAPYTLLVEGVFAEKALDIAVVNVLCVLKSNGTTNFPARIFIQSWVRQNSCQANLEFVVGERNLVVLMKSRDLESDVAADLQFTFYEPDLYTKGVFPVTKQNLEDCWGVCDVNPRDGMEECPSVLATSPCISGGTGLVPVSLLSMVIFVSLNLLY